MAIGFPAMALEILAPGAYLKEDAACRNNQASWGDAR